MLFSKNKIKVFNEDLSNYFISKKYVIRKQKSSKDVKRSLKNKVGFSYSFNVA